MGAQGFLSAFVEGVQLYTDDEVIGSKWSAARLIRRQFYPCYQQVLTELSGTSDKEVLIRHSITLASGTTRYILPPHIEKIRQLVYLDTDDPTIIEREILPAQTHLAVGPRWWIEGNVLVLNFDPEQYDGESWSLWYAPGGTFFSHEGTATSATATTLVLSSSPSLGDLDTRDNAYLGATVRILDDTNGVSQERAVTTYARSTRTATVTESFSPTPSGTITYDILPPLWSPQILDAVIWLASRRMLAANGPKDKNFRLAREYQESLRAARSHLNRFQGRLADRFNDETRDTRPRMRTEDVEGYY